jgi:hypothetical protein
LISSPTVPGALVLGIADCEPEEFHCRLIVGEVPAVLDDLPHLEIQAPLPSGYHHPPKTLNRLLTALLLNGTGMALTCRHINKPCSHFHPVPKKSIDKSPWIMPQHSPGNLQRQFTAIGKQG